MSATRVPWCVPRGHTGLSEHGDPRVGSLLEPSVLRYQSNGEGGLQRCAGWRRGQHGFAKCWCGCDPMCPGVLGCVLACCFVLLCFEGEGGGLCPQHVFTGGCRGNTGLSKHGDPHFPPLLPPWPGGYYTHYSLMWAVARELPLNLVRRGKNK